MFDGGIFFGKNPTNGFELSEKSLINWFETNNIQKAVVTHYKSIFFDYREGNEELLKLYNKYPDKIVPAVIISPYGFNIFKDIAYIDKLIDSEAKILGIYKSPKYYDIQLESSLMRKIAETAATKGLILQFGLESISDLYKVVDYYGHLSTTILIRWMNGRGYYNIAEMINVCNDYKQFYFDVSAINNCDGIKFLIETVGAERFYLASNFPEGFAHTSHLLVNTAGLSDESMEHVYFKTLATLLGEDIYQSIKTLKGNISSNWKELIESPKIDIHWHYDSWNLIDQHRDILKIYDNIKKYNINKVVISSSKALNYDLKCGNADILDLIEKDQSDTIYGYIVIDPLRVEDSLKEIEKYAQHKKFVGLKTIQDLYGFSLNHRNYYPIFEKARENNFPILAHIPGLKEAAETFPEVTFISAHSTWERIKHLIGIKNVYFEIATSHNNVDETKLELFIKKAGAERILFGSDAQLISPSWTLGKIASSSISENIVRKILYENAFHVFSKLHG